MVLINGVKYACERCIRGHRVLSCSHTDQPLTMIKPKGRPSTQCQHCKEQRKLKNLHINCNCAKHGHEHAASCAKSVCTCYQNHKLKAMEKAKKLPKKAESSSLISLDDMLEHKLTGGGLFDFSEDNSDVPPSGDNYFPLFPLVGSESFNTENMPLLKIPDHFKSAKYDSDLDIARKSSVRSITSGSTSHSNSGLALDAEPDYDRPPSLKSVTSIGLDMVKTETPKYSAPEAVILDEEFNSFLQAQDVTWGERT